MSKSIRQMNFVLGQRELESGPRIEKPKPGEELHYWHLERWSKKKQGWIFMNELFMTKRQAAEYFSRYCEPGTYRLHHQYQYGEKA